MIKRISGYNLLILKLRITSLFICNLLVQFRKVGRILLISKTSTGKKVNNFLSLKKAVYLNGKYYWNLYSPGFPSKPFKYVVKLAISKAIMAQDKRLGFLIVAITKKCSFNCEHCFEWNEINKKDVFTEEQIDKILSVYFKNRYFGQIFFSGGEPLNRYSLLLSLVKKYHAKCDCWIISSGYGLNADKAKELKTTGLTGIVISLDNFDQKKHDEFRGMPGSYISAVNAIKNANNAGLLTALSLCVTNENLSADFLDKYILLAKSINVSFVQILEPKAEGRLENKDVKLSAGEISLLENFLFKYNMQKKFRDYPVIIYPDYNRRIRGCEGMSWYAYIDTNGDLHACPFCKGLAGECSGCKETEVCEVVLDRVL